LPICADFSKIHSMAAKPASKRRVLITGGGSGIGAVTAVLLASRGWRVAIIDINETAARRTIEQIGADKAFFYNGNIVDPEAIETVMAAMAETWGGIDDLINNVGIWDHAPLLELSLERWRKVFEVNVFSAISASNAAVRRMKPGSAIVNVSSVLGQVAAPDRGPYCVSKSALISLTKVQAVEWAELGIRVNAIAPGYISNAATQAFIAQGGVDAEAVNRRTPMGRFGSEQEIAEGIGFLLDPNRASYITGHTLEVNGGWTAYGFT
jgi:NAD(P)-dependent dehydrogenase (short-subunit alcohol dehydrogenase family)